MTNIIIKEFKSPVGELLIGSYENKLCLCDWKYRKQRDLIDNRLKNNLKSEYTQGTSKIIEQTISELNEYFNGERNEFTIPILLVGTEFQKSVWNSLIKIRYGEKKTYKHLALDLDNLKAIRAVASANGANCISILIPCHRIIGSNGELVGYAGGLNAKQKLLKLESIKFQKELVEF